MKSSDHDEEGLVDLFAAGDEVEPEYTIEQMIIDRQELSREGETACGFTPLFDRFDNPTKREEGVETSPKLPLRPMQVYFRNKRHSLWGHKLWNAARYFVKRIDSGMIDVRGKTVLELGAGLGVPSLAAFRNGARCVVVTDYPDESLMEILRMNTETNCTLDQLDPTAAEFLRQEAVRLKSAYMSVHKGQETGKGDDREGKGVPLNSRCVVQPLLWGNTDHIREALKHTSGTGFDVLLLSDILFNHVCNDDLAGTVVQLLQRSPKAAAYCAFSHHRAHRQVEDLMFFDICASRGLLCEQIDEEDYPLMFPDDRGPEEIRRPVKVYKLSHRFDAAGVPLEPGQETYDVVVQGTGMVECFLAAALARSGVRVLQCDAQGEYGGPFKTLTVQQLRKYILQPPNDSGDGSSPSDGYAGGSQQVSSRGSNKDPSGVGNNNGNGDENTSTISVDLMDTLDVRTQHRFLLDLLPVHYFSKGDTVRKFVESDMARHAEFQCCSSFAFLFRCGETDESCAFRLQSVPLTRAQVFSADHIGLMQKRRLMKFVKDVAAPLAEHLHARTAALGEEEPGHTDVQEVGELFQQEVSQHPNETLSELLRRKYAVDETTLNIVTLLGQLETSSEPCMLRAVDLVRQVLTSIGAYGGSTPFLVPLYGASEVPQNMCRIAAVWNAVFVLRRSVSRVLKGLDTPTVEMSNRQHVKAKVVVVPRALASKFASVSGANDANDENITRFSRVVIVAKQPLVTWKALSSSGCCEEEVTTATEGLEGTAKTSSVEGIPPLVFALCQAQPGVVVHVQQQSASSEQAPKEGNAVVVHFTVNNCQMSAKQLHRFVEESFIASAASAGEDCVVLDKDAILFFASFVLDEREEALRGVAHGAWDFLASETEKAHPFAVEEYRKRQKKSKCDLVEFDDDGVLIVPVPTLLQNLMDDGAYLKEAQQAYETVVARLQMQMKEEEEEGDKTKQYVFLEPLPPVPSVSSR
ncbi:Rab geranylgeranyl transferase component A [Trypanosoma brucei equiperdum]|uniref:Rab geranylgeranyl transferase component A n=1 Tax=Trypanosoma brucei equiperdum TaxID=630700 RepID=A0A3L6L184_9TRYP|nr:Rab geranylgeranyl transferase component A [Trypanosoma brucei equiperdum]